MPSQHLNLNIINIAHLSLEDVVVDLWWCWVDLKNGRAEEDSGIGEVGEVSLEILVGDEYVCLASGDSGWDLSGCNRA